MTRVLKLSASELANLNYLEGDLDSQIKSNKNMLDGTIIHQMLQRRSEKESKDKGIVYFKEYFLEGSYVYKDIKFIIEGRADSIYIEDDKVLIEEIKSTGSDKIDEAGLSHLAQLKIYGYLYMKEEAIDEINLRLTYCQRESYKINHFEYILTYEEAKHFLDSLIEKYFAFFNLILKNENEAIDSLQDLKFPFKAYREEQRKLTVAVYKTIEEGKNIIAEAPTGTGKTISTVFPALKAMGEGLTSKIFYLTAKNITAKVAKEAVILMQAKGLRIRTLNIRAKDKICFKEETICEPDYCEYAKGFYSRINHAIEDIIKNEYMIDYDILVLYGKKHKVCPFEFSLMLINYTEIVICDYNYIFDPRVSLKSALNEASKYTVLIDESHNLLDRARQMYSCTLSKNNIDVCKKLLKDKNLNIVLNQINSLFNKAELKNNIEVLKDYPDKIYNYLKKTLDLLDYYFDENAESPDLDFLKDFYFEVLNFSRISDFFSDDFKIYFEKTSSDFLLKIFCMDPSKVLSDSYKALKSAVLFSATLSPIAYYKDILGLAQEDYSIVLNSYFPKDNFKLLIDGGIATRYRKRESSYPKIANLIKKTVEIKKGNYMVFFPSYKYLEDCLLELDIENYTILVQESDMNEEKRLDFISKFEKEQNILGLVVMGGVFSEGLDLLGDKLIGCLIVGPAIPQISNERDFIRQHFDRKNNQGYEYAYIYPGMNKVLQSAGRLIRSEEDKGVLLLIDDRFLTNTYKSLFPLKWSEYERIEYNNFEDNLLKFWS